MLKIDNEFVELNKKFVYSIVNKYCNNQNKEDLYQIGMLALMNASETFDESLNIKFSTYAYKYVLGDILKYLRENKNIKPSRDIIRLHLKILKLKEFIYLTEGRLVSTLELSKILKIEENKILEAEKLCQNTESLESDLTTDGNFTLKDTIKQNESIDKNDLIELKYALKKLKLEEKKFLYKRYYENKTQTEIAKENNTNQVKIYRYERAILDKLKEEIDA